MTQMTQKNLLWMVLSLCNIVYVSAQTINFRSLEVVSLIANDNYFNNERVIVMEGDIVLPEALPQDMLYSSNVSLIDNQHGNYLQYFSDLSIIQSEISSLGGESLNNYQSGTTIAPGTYNVNGNLTIAGFVSLVGNTDDQFIFNISGNLIFNDFTSLITDGLNPKNIIWNVSGEITSGFNTIVSGIFIANDNIDFSKFVMGPVTLFSSGGAIGLSSLLKIQSPDGQSVSSNQQLGAYGSCDPPATSSSASGTSCSQTYSTLIDPSSWKINSGLNQNSPLIKIGVNFHVLQDATGGNNFQNVANGDMLVLLQLFDWARSLIRNPRAPRKPITSVCGTCHVQDSKIELVWESTEFYQSNTLNTSISASAFQTAMNNRDPEMIKDLNIFWTQGTLSTASAFANRTVAVNGSTTQDFLFVVMLNQYKGSNIYNPSATYQGHYATSITIAHEVGHNFDYPHTYSGGGAWANCNTSSLEYLDDVHGPTNNSICPHNPVGGLWSCNSRNTDPHCTNNIMSGNYEAQYLSPKQIGIAQNNLRSKTLRQKISNCPYSSTPLEVITNETWDKDIFLYRDVIVKNNSVLTITCKLGLPEDAIIDVEKGSKLVIDGGKISSSCKDKYWAGILLRGDNNSNQLPLSQPTNQAKLEMKNGALVENVMYAVMFGQDGSWNDFGALVQAEDATFRVVRRAVEFMSYPLPNNSRFERCTFEYVSDVIDNPLPLVTLWDNKGAVFSGCTFENTTTINDYDQIGASGFFSIDATYEIKSDCDLANPPSPCPTANYTKSVFKNLNQGVYATGAATSTKTVSVEDVKFENNAIAFRVDALDRTSFIKNTVEEGSAAKNFNPRVHEYGILMENATGFEIEQNNFIKTGTVPTIGVNIVESGPVANEVYNNTFDGNDIAQKYDEMNRFPLSSTIGLQFLCNNHINSPSFGTDVSVNGLSTIGPNFVGIRQIQGNSSQSNGNIFSNGSVRIDNNTSPTITYYYNGPSESPTPSTGPVVGISTTQTNGCATRHLIRNKYGPVLPSNLIASYHSDLAIYNNLLYSYYQLLDAGNTDSLVQAINLSMPSQAVQLRDDLMFEAPYLSEEALMNAAATGILTDALLLEVCLANPDATKSEAFLDFIEFEIPNPLPSNMVQLIYQNWDTETSRTLLELQLADYSSTLGRASSHILQFYALDSIDHDDSIVSILESRNTISSDYQLVDYAIEKGDFTLANSRLNTIAQENSLNSEQLVEHTNYLSYVSFREGLVNSGKSYMQLNESELTTLRAIANSNARRSSNYAWNILCFGYGECREVEQNNLRLSSRNNRIYDFKESVEKELDETSFTLYPNPSRENLFIDFDKYNDQFVYTYRIMNMHGKIMKEGRIQSGLQEVNTEGLSKASYILIILENGNQFERQSFAKL